MEGGNDSSDRAIAAPKKRKFSLSIFLAPTTQLETSIGIVYLFSLRVSDVIKYGEIPAGESSIRIREFLPSIASLFSPSDTDKERRPLSPENVQQLSVEELNLLSEAYISSNALQQAIQGSKDRINLPREDSEAATNYLDRLLKKEIADQAENMRRMHNKILGSTSGLFDSVRKSSSMLNDSLTEYEKLSSSSLLNRQIGLQNHIVEQSARLARERAEELEMVRLTGKMAAESAGILRDLAEAATTLLEDLAEREKKSDSVTSKQLWIAVGSVVVSAVLALVALIFSGAAYYQDKANNMANDKWQAEVSSSLNESNRGRNAIELENKRLQVKVQELIATYEPKAQINLGKANVKKITAHANKVEN
jgi:hypothetical protein